MKLSIAILNFAIVVVGVHLLLTMLVFYNSIVEIGAVFILLICIRSVLEIVTYAMECVKRETF